MTDPDKPKEDRGVERFAKRGKAIQELAWRKGFVSDDSDDKAMMD